MEEKSSIVSVFIDLLECPSQITQIETVETTIKVYASNVFIKQQDQSNINKKEGD